MLTKLLKIGKVESSLCSFCSSSPETLEHLFVYCTCTQKFWIDLYDFIECTPTITIPNILYGQVNGQTTLLESLAILIGKKIIYYSSLKETIPHVKEAVYDLKSHMETDFYYNRIIPRNMEKWNPIIHKFNNLWKFQILYINIYICINKGYVFMCLMYVYVFINVD